MESGNGDLSILEREIESDREMAHLYEIPYSSFTSMSVKLLIKIMRRGMPDCQW